MEIVDKYYKIKEFKKPVTLEFIENFLMERQIFPIRWAIVDVQKDYLLLNTVVFED